MGGCAPHILPPGSIPGHKLQKQSKECGVFQSLGTINFVLFFTKKQNQRGGRAWNNAPFRKYAPAMKSRKGLLVLMMSYKKIKGLRLDSQKEFTFLQVRAGRIKRSRGPDPARGPYVAHTCVISIATVNQKDYFNRLKLTRIQPYSNRIIITLTFNV